MENVKTDLWLHKGDPVDQIPTDAEFLCSYFEHFGVDSIPEVSFIRRTESEDELWFASGIDADFMQTANNPEIHPWMIHRNSVFRLGRVIWKSRENDIESAAIGLLDKLYRGRLGYEFPVEFITAGVLNQEQFNEITGGIEREIKDNCDEALKNESPIINAARELGISPSPAGVGSHQWSANCPGTSHSIWISTLSNTFGCGYCRRKGGPEELIEFVKLRRARRKELGH